MAKFDSDRWKNLSVLLDQALELDTCARAAWLDRLTSGDADAAAALRRLLAHAKSTDPANSSADDPAFGNLLREALISEDNAEPSGQRIGAWTTRSVLGTGGMGAVYLADRELDDGIQRGALKLIRRGMDSDEILARFRRERQILIRLAHPSIAPLLDGGVTVDGRPYLVMGYIDGVPLDVWAQRTDIDLDARCNLVLQICDAVAHAHRLLIVHRDIKPSNVLVDVDNRPHLLDFGIAKVLEDTADADKTATVARVFTRAYAAPEQASGAAVTTSVDVYQLGVLLFELLTGARFHDNPDATTGHPSQRLAAARSRVGNKGPAAVNVRTLRGDAGVIVARATDAEPARRYASAEALAEDIRRWRAGLPILARTDSARYRMAKFARRHVVGIAAVAAIALALIAGTGIALWQARLARAQAARAEVVNAFLEHIFASIDPENAKGREVSAKELIDAGVARIGKDLADQAAAAAQLRATLGATYFALGDYAHAEAQYRAALPLFSSEQAALAIDTQAKLAEVRISSGDLDDAQRLIDAAEVRQRAELPQHAGLADTLLGMRASLASERGDSAQATQLAAQRWQAMRSRLGDEAADTIEAEQNYAVYLSEMTQHAEATAHQTHVVAARRKSLGDEHPSVAVAWHNLGNFQSHAGLNQEALASDEEALRIRRKVLPPNHPDIARSLGAKAMQLQHMGRAAEALRLRPETIAILRAQSQPDRLLLAQELNNWGTNCYAVGDIDGAIVHIGEALSLWQTSLPVRHPNILTGQSNLAALLTNRGDLKGGETHLRSVLAMRLADIDENGASENRASGLRTTREALTVNLHWQLRDAQALQVARANVADTEKQFPSPNSNRAAALSTLARTEADNGDYASARRHALAAIEQFEQLHTQDNSDNGFTVLALAYAELGSARYTEAEAAARDAIKMLTTASGETHWRVAEARGLLGRTLLALGRKNQARAELDFAIASLAKQRPWLPELQLIRSARRQLGK